MGFTYIPHVPYVQPSSHHNLIETDPLIAATLVLAFIAGAAGILLFRKITTGYWF